GLPERPVLSSVFFAMALEAGLGAAIVNPKDGRMMDAFRGAMVLLGKDVRAEEYIAHYGQAKTVPAMPAAEGQAPGIRQ
ncbi:MAG: hypothetical protein GWN87_27360, partial [Desulfuromonadales bacterium]|nr:hypothetical protein [Desulfuromonadales bacterium]NIS43440.1 hypothetical protein [Desulfuromonadales bacterium]